MKAQFIKKFVIVAIVSLLVLYILMALLADTAASHPFFTGIKSRPLVIAHRGGKGLWPENTVYAFQYASNMGVDVLEMDLHSTRDGALVMIHDKTVDRTTDGAGEVQSFTLSDLKELDAAYHWSPDDGETFPYRGIGIEVPTLDEVFAGFNGQHLNIEIKQAQPSITGPFCEMIRENQMEEKVLVASFDQETLREFQRTCPEVATSLGEDDIRTFYILNTLFLGNIYSPTGSAVQAPEHRGGIHVLTRRFITGAHNRGLEVHAWTINDTYTMQRLLALGVDGIITDYPNLMLALLGR